MDINLSLLGQMITFILFVWFTMHYVWPPLKKAMDDRQKKIAAGLIAAEQAQRDLESAERKATDLLREAKLQASHVVEQANSRALRVVEEAKETARTEAMRLLALTKAQVDVEYENAKRELRQLVGQLSLDVAAKMIRQDINPKTHQQVLDSLLTEI